MTGKKRHLQPPSSPATLSASAVSGNRGHILCKNKQASNYCYAHMIVHYRALHDMRKQCGFARQTRKITVLETRHLHSSEVFEGCQTYQCVRFSCQIERVP